jgi:hypothetical protein
MSVKSATKKELAKIFMLNSDFQGAASKQNKPAAGFGLWLGL